MSRRGLDGTVYSQTVWDEPKKPNIVYLLAADGRQIGYIEKACVQIGRSFYAVMELAQSCYGMQRGQIVVFHVYRGNQGEDRFDLVQDRNLFNEIMYRYSNGQCTYVN